MRYPRLHVLLGGRPPKGPPSPPMDGMPPFLPAYTSLVVLAGVLVGLLSSRVHGPVPDMCQVACMETRGDGSLGVREQGECYCLGADDRERLRLEGW